MLGNPRGENYFPFFLCKELNVKCPIFCIPWKNFELHILGCGSALPTTRHFCDLSSRKLCVKKLFMIDCGEGAQMQLRRSRLKFSRLNHIFISHLHGDHCFGLLGLISTFGLLGRTAICIFILHEDWKNCLHRCLLSFVRL